MALAIPTNFENDIHSNHTNIYPFVVIDLDGLNIRISTNAITIGDDFHKPLLLNVPSLKESIDLETRKYKINSVTLDISNVEYEGTRFSDLVSSKSLMNAPVLVKWGSPSTTDYGTGFTVYNGTVRRYTHTDEKVKIELEDRSQAYLHKDLPIANLGSDNNVPLVYGYVDNSPLLNFNTDERLKLYADNTNDSNILNLNVYVDGKYVKVRKNTKTVFDEYSFDLTYVTPVERLFSAKYNQDDELIGENFSYPLDNDQWALANGNSNIIEFHNRAGGDKVELNTNPLYDNRIIVEDIILMNDLKITPLNTKSTYWSSGGSGASDVGENTWYNSLYYDAGNSKDVFGTVLTEKNNDDWDGSSYITNTSTPNDPLGSDSLVYFNLYNQNSDDDNKGQRSILGAVINVNTISSALQKDQVFLYSWEIENANVFNMGGSGAKKLRFRVGEDGVSDYKRKYELGWNEYDNSQWQNVYHPSGNRVSTDAVHTRNGGNILIYLMFLDGERHGVMAGRIRLFNYEIRAFSLLDNIINLNYYAEVEGRLSTGVGDSPTISSAISDILEKELGVDNASILGSGDFYTGFNYAFTVHKKTNSKKLIESIASASPYIPHFNNQGNFKFDVIPSSNPSSDHIIQESKIIDFTYKRTKIENVKTKIELKYKINYARDEFSKSVTKQEDNSDLFNYYGLESDHSLSTLVVDDDRGKYIRDDLTADKFCEWLLDYHKNQHLIMIVKLPLSVGLPIEVGDIVEFDKLLGDVKPYGINYVYDYESSVFADNENINGQIAFPNLIVTSTNKTLDMVTIECEQLHELLFGYISEDRYATFFGEDVETNVWAKPNPAIINSQEFASNPSQFSQYVKNKIPVIKKLEPHIDFTSGTYETPYTPNNFFYIEWDQNGNLVTDNLQSLEEDMVYKITCFAGSEITTDLFIDKTDDMGNLI